MKYIERIVTARDGSLTGCAWGLRRKEFLLALEAGRAYGFRQDTGTT